MPLPVQPKKEILFLDIYEKPNFDQVGVAFTNEEYSCWWPAWHLDP